MKKLFNPFPSDLIISNWIVSNESFENHTQVSVSAEMGERNEWNVIRPFLKLPFLFINIFHLPPPSTSTHNERSIRFRLFVFRFSLLFPAAIKYSEPAWALMKSSQLVQRHFSRAERKSLCFRSAWFALAMNRFLNCFRSPIKDFFLCRQMQLTLSLSRGYWWQP